MCPPYRQRHSFPIWAHARRTKVRVVRGVVLFLSGTGANRLRPYKRVRTPPCCNQSLRHMELQLIPLVFRELERRVHTHPCGSS